MEGGEGIQGRGGLTYFGGNLFNLPSLHICLCCVWSKASDNSVTISTPHWPSMTVFHRRLPLSAEASGDGLLWMLDFGESALPVDPLCFDGLPRLPTLSTETERVAPDEEGVLLPDTDWEVDKTGSAGWGYVPSQWSSSHYHPQVLTVAFLTTPPYQIAFPWSVSLLRCC